MQSYASHLRKALGPDRLEGSRAGYRLRAEPSELDATRFQSLLRDARRLLRLADGAGDPTPVKNEGGKYYDKEGNPTFKVQSDGTVDWSTYSGFRRYHSDCHVCHGPDGEGSSYAPALSNKSVKTSPRRLPKRKTVVSDIRIER